MHERLAGRILVNAEVPDSVHDWPQSAFQNPERRIPGRYNTLDASERPQEITPQQETVDADEALDVRTRAESKPQELVPGLGRVEPLISRQPGGLRGTSGLQVGTRERSLAGSGRVGSIGLIRGC